MEAHSGNSDSVPVAIQVYEDLETRVRGNARDDLEFGMAVFGVKRGRREKDSTQGESGFATSQV
jgi:hypothetical protein